MQDFGTKKKRPDSSFTLLLVPEDKGRVQSWHLPPWISRAAAFGASALVVGMAYFSFSYFSLHNRVEKLQYLETVQEAQEEEIRRLQDAATQMQERLEAVDTLDQTIRQMVGLEGGREVPIPPSRGGSGELLEKIRDLGGREKLSRGGAVDLSELRYTLEAIDQEIRTDEIQLAQLQEEVTARLDYLASVPSTWPVKGSISSPFGYRQSPFGSKKEYHNGLDIAADYGRTIVAAADGVVTSSQWKSGFGRVVTIDHGHGFVTEYAHCSALLVKAGERVKRGQAIAKVGSSGRSTGPHLHLIVLKNGREVDPLKYLNSQGDV